MRAAARRGRFLSETIFGDVAVKGNSIRIEVHPADDILAYTNRKVAAYANGPVRVRLAVQTIGTLRKLTLHLHG